MLTREIRTLTNTMRFLYSGLGALKRYHYDFKKLNNAFKYQRYGSRYPLHVPYGPLSATFVIESRCNLRCRMCVYHALETTRPRTDFWISFDEFKQVADIMFDNGLLNPNLCAIGEPFLNKDIFKMIDYCKRKKAVVCSVLSNGSKVISDKIDQIVCSGLDIFTTDLDSGDPAQYEYIKRRASWEIVIDNISKLVESREKHRVNLKIDIDCIVMKYNYKTLRDLVRICSDLGVDQLNLSYLVPIESTDELVSAKNVIRPDDYEIIEEINKAADLGRQLKLVVAVPGLYDVSRQGEIMCSALWRKLMINLPNPELPKDEWLGNASLHCKLSTYEEGASFGNILKQPFQEVWNGQKIIDLRRRLLAGTPPRECMEDCPQYFKPDPISNYKPT